MDGRYDKSAGKEKPLNIDEKQKQLMIPLSWVFCLSRDLFPLNFVHSSVKNKIFGAILPFTPKDHLKKKKIKKIKKLKN